jgi:pimeloyl-ACP methyl ester carboxylesterase
VHRDVSVVLLHGQPGTGSDWDAVVHALPPQLRSLALDRPGYRANPHPPGTFRENAEWLVRELDRADVQDVILVGHSYGGGVALSAAALAPERVRGLVLVSSIGPECLDHWDSLLAAPFAGPVCAVAAWWLTPWFARRALARIERLRDRPLAHDEHVNWTAWANASHDRGAVWRTFLTEQRSLVDGLDELNSLLGEIVAPTVVIADSADKIVPFVTAEALRDQVPGARLILAGEGGHHLPRRVPNIIAAEIARLAQVP